MHSLHFQFVSSLAKNYAVEKLFETVVKAGLRARDISGSLIEKCTFSHLIFIQFIMSTLALTDLLGVNANEILSRNMTKLSKLERPFKDSIKSDSVEVKNPRRVVAAGATRLSVQHHNDRCEVCLRGGGLVCCDTCSNVFHLRCIRPKIFDIPKGKWSCCHCIFEVRMDTVQHS